MLVRDFRVLEFHHDDVWDFHMFAGGWHSRQQIIPLRVVRKAQNKFVYHLVFADGAGDRCHLRIFGDLVYEVLTVEPADSQAADAARHDWNAVHMRVGHHGFHSGLDVVIGKLSRYVPVEQRTEIEKFFAPGLRRTPDGHTHIGCCFLSDVRAHMVGTATPSPLPQEAPIPSRSLGYSSGPFWRFPLRTARPSLGFANSIVAGVFSDFITCCFLLAQSTRRSDA